ncbi:hypothetical protein UPYG_G00317660 [Umbra pygmaea]|uniref:Uncharacterized protein n=1 Tax=Umbra pygmaea TaxID=75934 RepID=A0ABD0W053_UMBPY
MHCFRFLPEKSQKVEKVKESCKSISSVQMVWVFIMNRMGSSGSIVAQRRRMALGVVILLLVDVIWVASSELTSTGRNGNQQNWVAWLSLFWLTCSILTSAQL